jgi:hypothetical protein
MSWRTWVRATAIRLGIAEQGSISVEMALENLRTLEDQLNALRARILEASATRQIYVEEAIAYDVARGNVFASTKVLREELVRLGVPPEQLPLVTILAPLPQSIIEGVRFAPTGAQQNAAFGAIRVGRDGVPQRALAGGEWAGTLGNPITIAQALVFGGVVIGIIAASAALGYVLVDLVHPEVGLQQAIAASDIAIAEAWQTGVSAWEETRRAAIENGVDPNTLTPPVLPDLTNLGRGNPFVQGMSAAKGIIGGLVVLGALWVGYKVWKSKDKE